MSPPELYTYRAAVNRVIDGDTYELLVDLGFFVSIAVRVRLQGANCPELHTPEGQIARDYVVALLAGREVIVRTEKTPVRSFERYVARVFLGDTDLAANLIETGHAVAM